jgi:hypothetical protein
VRPTIPEAPSQSQALRSAAGNRLPRRIAWLAERRRTAMTSRVRFTASAPMRSLASVKKREVKAHERAVPRAAVSPM